MRGNRERSDIWQSLERGCDAWRLLWGLSRYAEFGTIYSKLFSRMTWPWGKGALPGELGTSELLCDSRSEVVRLGSG